MSGTIFDIAGRYVPEVLLVLIFMVFILRRDETSAKDMAARDQMWAGFLIKQREATGEALQRLAGEVNANTQQLIAVTTLLTNQSKRRPRERK